MAQILGRVFQVPGDEQGLYLSRRVIEPVAKPAPPIVARVEPGQSLLGLSYSELRARIGTSEFDLGRTDRSDLAPQPPHGGGPGAEMRQPAPRSSGDRSLAEFVRKRFAPPVANALPPSDEPEAVRVMRRYLAERGITPRSE
jgi:hypothetical protein